MKLVGLQFKLPPKGGEKYSDNGLRYTVSLIYVSRRIQAIQEGFKFKWYTVASNYADVNVLDGSGLGSSVGIATDCRLDSPGSNPGGDKIFCLSRMVLGPTQPPV